jgi:osmotically-inducible protein OsmY
VDADGNIVKQVEAALERDPHISLREHPLKIALDPDGALILEGELESIAAKKLALEHAAAIPGVIGIVDRLRIAPATPMGDGEIRDHVRNALLEEPAIAGCAIRIMNSGRWDISRELDAIAPRCSIDVMVDDGVVTLDGHVSSLSHKRLAGVLAWWVPGTRDVVNGLEVVPIREDSDDEIAEAVNLVLEKDPLIEADRILVTIRYAVVTLEGLVANRAESEMAEMDAWYVFGVDRVVNLLEHER